VISVIIPTLNEESLLAATLQSVARNSVSSETIVVDSDSQDATIALAEQEGATVLRSPIRQRAAQMNLGAEKASGEILLFLHADTLLPENGMQNIIDALSHNGIVGGAFFRRFDHQSRFLNMTCRLSDLRSRISGWHLGDQAIFAKKSCFMELAGFPLQDRFEDLAFSRLLKTRGRVVTLAPPIITSGRRFASQPIRRTLRDFKMTCQYLTSQ